MPAYFWDRTLGVGFGWLLLSDTEFGIEAGDIPLTAAVAGFVCVLACAHPVWLGVRVQPTEALRES